MLQGAALGVWFGSPLILIYVIAGALSWNFAARPWEEADLRARFGADYERYRRTRALLAAAFVTAYRNQSEARDLRGAGASEDE